MANLRLRSHCTIFCKRLNARVDFHHTNSLECLEGKIFASGKKLACAKRTLFKEAPCWGGGPVNYIPESDQLEYQMLFSCDNMGMRCQWLLALSCKNLDT